MGNFNPNLSTTKDFSIIYTAGVVHDKHHPIWRFQLIRQINKNKDLSDVTTYLLKNISDNGTKINYNEYTKWIQDSFKAIDFYYSVNPDKKFQDTKQPNIFTFKMFKEHKLDEIYSNLLLSTGAEQKLYVVQYCNSDYENIKMIACDFLYNAQTITIKNKELLTYILQGKIDQIEEMLQ